MSRNRFQELTKCLHLINSTSYVDDPALSGFDKICQLRSEVEIKKVNFITIWNVDEFFTVDKMMICYKGSYCLAHQYMPKKTQK